MVRFPYRETFYTQETAKSGHDCRLPERRSERQAHARRRRLPGPSCPSRKNYAKKLHLDAEGPHEFERASFVRHQKRRVAPAAPFRLERDLEKARGVTKELRAQLSARESDGVLRTEGTRLVWSTLREWLDAWTELHRRRLTGARIVASRRHVEALPEWVVAAAGADELAELEGVLAGPNVTPPRGKRMDHHTTKLRDAIDPARARASRPVRRGFEPERRLEVAIGALRARPPVGVDAEYVTGFVARNRGTLLGIVRGAFPAA